MRAKGPQPGTAAASAAPMEKPDPVLPVEETKDEVPTERPNDEGDFYMERGRHGVADDHGGAERGGGTEL